VPLKGRVKETETGRDALRVDMAVHEHRQKATKTIRCFIITVSDTRDEATDGSGAAIREQLEAYGHEIVGYRIVKDEPQQIEALLKEATTDSKTDVVILNGGTGIAPRDGTYEIVSRSLDKRLDGFGELFRYLSYQDIGSAAMMSRAIAGTVGHCVVISLPGSTAAVRLAMDKLILPEIGHMVSQLQGQ